MTIVTRVTAKTYFETGDYPTQNQFVDFIDSALFYEDTADYGRTIVSASGASIARSRLGSGIVGGSLFQVNTTASAFGQLGGGTFGNLLFSTNTTASGQQHLGGGAAGINIFAASTTASATNLLGLATTSAVGTRYLSSDIKLSVNVSDSNNDTDFLQGTFRFSDGSGEAYLPTAMTKRLDANWTAGTGGGGLDSGSKGIDSFYHSYGLFNPTTGAVDIIQSTSDTAPTMALPNASGFTKYGIIPNGAIRTDVSSNIRGYVKNGKRTMLNTPVADVTSTNPGISAVTRNLTVPANYTAIVSFEIVDTTMGSYSMRGVLTALSSTDVSPDSFSQVSFRGASGTIMQSTSPVQVVCNSLGQIRSRINNSDSDVTVNIATFGFIDEFN